MSVSYQDASANWIMNVTQDANQAPDIQMPGNLNFTIPVCTAELTSHFAIQIDDDCDANIDIGAGAIFTLDGDVITPVVTTNLQNQSVYFEFEENLTEAEHDGVYLVATYEDTDGLVSTLSTQLAVDQQEDNWAPVIVYPSQHIYHGLDACEAGITIVYFEVTATDNCDGDLDPIVTIDGAELLPSYGNTYAVALTPGNYHVEISAEDAAQNMTEEDFSIFVTQEGVEEVNLGCNNQINVNLNEDCQTVIIADMLLDGEFGCLTDADFEIIIHDSDLTNGNILDGCGDFIYEISYQMPAPVSDFTGDFAPGEWNTYTAGGATVNFNSSTLALSSAATSSFASASIAFAYAGHLSFDWARTGGDYGFHIRQSLVPCSCENRSGSYLQWCS